MLSNETSASEVGASQISGRFQKGKIVATEVKTAAGHAKDGKGSLPEKLAKCAERLAVRHAEGASETAAALIATTMREGDDALLEAALGRTRTREGWAVLWGMIENAVTTSVDYAGEAIDCAAMAELFAIPVLLGLAPEDRRNVPVQIPDIRWYVAAMEEHGLKDPRESMVLHGHLWTMAELNALSHTGLYRLNNRSAQAAFPPEEGGRRFDLPFPRDHSTLLHEGEHGIFLRFLVGTLLSYATDGPAYDWADKEAAADAWAEAASGRMQRDLLQRAVLVRAPRGFYRALAGGLGCYRYTLLSADAAHIHESADWPPEALRAGVSAHGADGQASEVRTAFWPPGADAAMLGRVWRLERFEDADAAVADMKRALVESGVSASVAPDVLPVADGGEGLVFTKPDPATWRHFPPAAPESL